MYVCICRLCMFVSEDITKCTYALLTMKIMKTSFY